MEAITLHQKIDDIYEAAYYLMMGAKALGIESRRVQNSKRKVSHKWIVEMENIPQGAYTLWQEGRAVGNIKDFEYTRLKLKRYIKKCLNSY